MIFKMFKEKIRDSKDLETKTSIREYIKFVNIF